MPLYTDMIMDNFEDYANHHEDDGVIKLQNMPEEIRVSVCFEGTCPEPGRG